MRKQDEAVRRLAKVVPTVAGGCAWYRARDVCEAIGANYDRSVRFLLPEHKRSFVVEYGRRNRVRALYINADGVAEIVRRRGWLSVRTMVAALAT